MKSKQLPLGKPIIHGFQFYAYPLSILAVHEEARPWLHSNFLQLCFYRDFEEGFVVPIAPYLYDYAVNPYLSVQRIQRETLKTFKTSILEFIRESIDRGWYLHLNIDQYHIPRREHYGNTHFAHDILVYGYDEETRMFDVLGFRDDLAFAPSQVSFEEFEAAYLSLDHIKNWSEEIVLYKFNPDGKFEFNVNLVADHLEEYLTGRNTSERVYMFGEVYDRAYGMDLYPHLKRYLQTLIAGDIWYDIKYLHILWEHKKCLLALVGYLEEQGHLDPALGYLAAVRELEQQAMSFRNAMLRAGMVENMTRLNNVHDSLDAFADKERELLTKLVASMRRSSIVHS
ncbi:hypothetical protein [Tumebacillus flagellatus]|uniref:Butirosin biosynthesis protein H N-terminal domain-containing protein n=1 Tax=Tumebacillus flagellatus TaxID=1157490 RepID=A0A074LUW8_9BACL|nr:hypothetical protein [Tumebacillus flagellatus]KEO84420.1 hypothetical protein EL26_04780 [Tumebacillus flagellatus]